MIKMIPTALRLLALSTLLISATELAWCAEKTSKLASVRIAYVSRSTLDMPYMIARDRGFFREEGLEPEFVFMKAIQTVHALTDKPSFDMVAMPTIASVEQLRGKKVGISAVGSLTEILARQILIAHKVPPEQVTF